MGKMDKKQQHIYKRRGLSKNQEDGHCKNWIACNQVVYIY